MNKTTSKKQESQKYSKVIIKSNFYLDNINKYAFLVIICTGLLAFFTYSVLFLYWNKPKDQYFAGYKDGSIIQDIPLNKKYYFDAEIDSWAAVSLMDLMSFDFLNYAENINSQSRRFTNNGFNVFVSWFKKELLNNMIENRFVLSTHLCGVVNLIDEGVNKDNIYSWDIQMPIVMVFQNSVKKEIVSAIANLNLVRVSSTDSFSGVHINSIKLDKLESAKTNKGRENCPTNPSYS